MMDVTLEKQPVLRSLGMKFPLDRSLLPRKVRKMLRQECYEDKEARAAIRIIRPHDRVLELGAGIGFISTLIGTKIAPQEIHCCEPSPLLIPYIQQVHQLNKVDNVHLHHILLGETDGEATFYIRDGILGSSLMAHSDDPEDIQTTTVPVRSGSAFMQEINPTVLVCDIEGAEADLFPHLHLSDLRAVIIELHPQWLGSEGIGKVIRCLDEAGLVFHPKYSDGKVAVFRSDW